MAKYKNHRTGRWAPPKEGETYAFIVWMFVAVVLSAGMFLWSDPALSAVSQPQEIGHANLVKNSVFGQKEKQPIRNIVLQDRVYFQEEIITGTESATQLTFTDGTTLTMGPHSRMTLDELIFDPDPNASKMAITMVKGVFSFVSGNLPSKSYVVKTPTSSIGLRGTAFSVEVKESGTSTIALSKGAVLVANLAGQITPLIQPGLASVVRAPPRGALPGAPPPPPTAPAPPPADMVAGLRAMNGLVAEAAAESGVEVVILKAPDKVGPPSTEESAHEGDDTDAGGEGEDNAEAGEGEESQGEGNSEGEDATAQDDATAQGDGNQTGDETGAGEGDAGTQEVQTADLDSGGLIDRDSSELESAGPQLVGFEFPGEPVPPPVMETHQLTVNGDASVTFLIYINESSGKAYGHYEGPVNGIYSVGVLTGEVVEGVVTGEIHLQPNEGVSASNYYYEKADVSIDLITGSGSIDLDSLDDTLVSTGTTTLSWTSELLLREEVIAIEGVHSAEGIVMYSTDNAYSPNDGYGYRVTDTSTQAENPFDGVELDDGAGGTTLVGLTSPGGPNGGGVLSDADGVFYYGTSPASAVEEYDYMAWGHWGQIDSDFATGGYSANGATSYWLAGQTTPASLDLGQLGITSATYSGKMMGGFLPGAGDPSDSTRVPKVLRGAFSILAKLGNSSFSGSFSLGDHTSASSAFISIGTITNGTWANGQLTGTLGATSFDAGTVAGTLNGSFFGPQAEEVGGTWDIDITGSTTAANDGIGNGIFAGKR